MSTSHGKIARGSLLPFGSGYRLGSKRTFAIRERTPLWLAEQLTAAAIHDPRFRRILRPADVTGPDLAAQIGETRDALVKHLTNLDPESTARTVRETALTELEYTT